MQSEQSAIEELESLIEITVTECGLFIDDKLTFLAASPDGIFEKGSIEIKRSFSAKYLTPVRGVQAKLIKFCNLSKEGN